VSERGPSVSNGEQCRDSAIEIKAMSLFTTAKGTLRNTAQMARPGGRTTASAIRLAADNGNALLPDVTQGGWMNCTPKAIEAPDAPAPLSTQESSTAAQLAPQFDRKRQYTTTDNAQASQSLASQPSASQSLAMQSIVSPATPARPPQENAAAAPPANSRPETAMSQARVEATRDPRHPTNGAATSAAHHSRAARPNLTSCSVEEAQSVTAEAPCSSQSLFLPPPRKRASDKLND